MYIQTREEPFPGFSPELGITTLEEYFNWLPDLKSEEVVDADGNKSMQPTKYTVLPLDEEPFVINANTRAINIPPDFKKNGIAVQGDDLAEVVYFKVDRYFDAMDLNNCEIYIQWEAPKNAEGKIEKGISDIYIKDIESEHGKIIFGWAISEIITNASGNLKFSVKFLQRNNDKKIVYSLNTLTAQVAIQPSIGIDLRKEDYKPDNANGRLLDRIQESEVVGGAQADTPYFIENIEVLEDGYDIEPNHYDGTYTLSAIARADDTGAISYVWRKRELLDNNEESLEAEKEMSGTVDYVAVKENAEGFPVLIPNAKRVYYYHNGSIYILYEESNGYEPNDLLAFFQKSSAEDLPKFYERKAMLVVEDAGVYTVEARNRIFNSITKLRSNIAKFKCPEPVRINNSNETPYGHILKTDSAVLSPVYDEAPVGEVTYQWYKAPEKNLLSEKFRFFDLPVGGDVSYSDEFVRILCPTNPDVYYEQNVGEGGQKDKFYITMRNYAPKGAVSLRMNGVNNLAKDPDPVITGAEELEILKDKAGYGKEGEKEYYNFWIHIAGYSNGAWKAWPTGKGDGEFIGYRYIIEWYDEAGNVIDTSFITIQLANEDNFDAMENFQAIETGTEKAYVASDEGLYKVKITRTRNRRSISENSIEYRVTEAPQVPEFAEGIYSGLVDFSMNELIIGDRVPTIKMTGLIPYDEYEVKWMLYRKDADENAEDLLVHTNYTTNNEIKFNPLDYAEILEENGENVEGRYYATVAIKRNGLTSAHTTVPDRKKMFVVTGSKA